MLKIINPSNEEVLAQLESDTPATVHEKFRRAKVAQVDWARQPMVVRKEFLKRFRNLLVEKRDDLALTLSQETGKPITQAKNEIGATPQRIDFFLEHVEKITAEELMLKEGGGDRPTLEEKISYEPLGVIANISAWNYPYFVGSNVFVPALLTGNAVLYKPSEIASLSGIAIAKLLWEAGVPQDVFAPVIGSGAMGGAVLEEPVNGIYFTGSVATGRKIAAVAASRLVKVQLELGGKDATYVCEDVDVKSAAESLADGAFYNAGQSCCAVERIYVHTSIYAAFMEHFLETVRGFVVGDPLSPKTYIGPLAREAQLAVLDEQVKDAVSKGAKLLCGGKRDDRSGYYYEPTVLTNVTSSMQVMRDESFGPIIGIAEVQNDKDVVALMNDSSYGLTSGVYTKDAQRAQRILSQMQSGTVYWNCCDRVSPRLPWSGRKQSGLGATLSYEGIRTFVQPKAWHLRSA